MIYFHFSRAERVAFGFSDAPLLDSVSILPEGQTKKAPSFCSSLGHSGRALRLHATSISIFAPYLQFSADLDFSFGGEGQRKRAPP